MDAGTPIDRRLIAAVLVLATGLAGCMASPAVSVPPAASQDSSSASPVDASMSPAHAQPTATPRTAPTPTPGPLAIEWARSAVEPGFRDLERINASATIGERFVVVGQRNVVGADGGSHAYPGIWFSDDGIRWHSADLEEGDREDSEIHDVAVGGAGLVAVGTGDAGAAVWLSTDGERWTRVHDDAFVPGRMWKVAATDSGIVAFGDDCLCISGQGLRAFWTSPDGLDWQRETSGPGVDVANGVGPIVVAEGELTVFVRDAVSADAATRPIEVWRTGDQPDWAKVGELPDSRGVDLWQAAAGPRGWVATGSTEAGPPSSWTSPDGVAWTVAPTTPGVVHALLADQAGFIAVGSRSTSTGCSEPPGAFIGKTWASSDGLVWRGAGSERAWTANAIMRLLQRGRTVIGVGLTYATDTSGHVEGAIWTTTLPNASVDTGPIPAATPRPSPGKGCGG